MSWPTLLFAVQLGFGAYAAFELGRSALSRRRGPFLIGQGIVAAVLLTLGADGLFLQSDLPGRIAYDLSIEPSWVRPGLIALILGGTLLWMSEDMIKPSQGVDR